MSATHEVFNQVEPLVDYNLFAGNQALGAALKFNAPALDTAHLHELGAKLGSADMQTHARLANVFTPQLKSHSRFGHRIDQVEFHPSYHALMGEAVGAGAKGYGRTAPAGLVRALRAPQGVVVCRRDTWGGTRIKVSMTDLLPYFLRHKRVGQKKCAINRSAMITYALNNPRKEPPKPAHPR